ncbi:MAG: dihydroorotase [Robiginitomaculum sp.]|nr:MAG: dihydroorotase [Robiginitomaculum sp.]
MNRDAQPILIRNARVMDPASGLDEQMDLAISGGKIVELGKTLAQTDEMQSVDAAGLVLCPGLIDLKVKTGEPGSEHRETLHSAGLAAAAGGVTTMVISPDTDPVIDDAALVEFIARSSRSKSLVNVLPAGALTKGLAGQKMAEIGLMSEAGAVLFSNGDQSIASADVMRKVLAYAGAFNALVSCRAEDATLAGSGVMHSGELSSRLGLKGIPIAAETINIARDIALAELTGGQLLIDQISSADGIALVRGAKAKGLEVFCSVSVHHLTLNELDVGEYRTFARLCPPLRAETDRRALVAGLADGTVDAIVSAHDPRPAEEKRLPFAESTPGACGLETLLCGALSLVHNEEISLIELLRGLTSGPADLLGLPSGRIETGAPADLILFDLDTPWVCDAGQLLSKSKNTPFDGRRMQGKTSATLVGGEVVYDSHGLFAG